MIQDEIVDRLTSESYISRLHHMVATVLALSPSGPRTLVVRQSTIQAHYARLFTILTELCPSTLIAQKNPKIRDDGIHGTRLNEFIFPVGEVCNMFSLGCEFLFMNDDNLRFVNLARKMRRRMMSNGVPFVPVRPSLILGGAPRLYGYNYMKMSKGNGNAIYLGMRQDGLRKEILRLASLNWLFKKGSRYRRAVKLGDEAVQHPEDFPIFSFYRAFVDPFAVVGGVVPGLENYIEPVISVAQMINERVLDGLTNSNHSQCEIRDRIIENERDAKAAIDRNLEGLFAI